MLSLLMKLPRFFVSSPRGDREVRGTGLAAAGRVGKCGNLKILHQNMGCLGNKIERVEVVLSAYSIDILLLSEHWQSTEQLSEISFVGFILKAFYCRPAYEHGGVAIYCRKNINCRVREDIGALSVGNVVEISAIELTTKNIVIIVLYRIPKSSYDVFLDRLSAVLTILNGEDKRIVLGGDFNVEFRFRSSCRDLLGDLLDSTGLSVTLDVPTRVTATSSSCIDNFITNLSFDEYESSCVDLNLSDHHAQFICIKLEFKNDFHNRYVWKYIFSDDGMVSFLNHLEVETWLPVFECNCPELAFRKFLDIFLFYVNKCFPYVRVPFPSEKSVNHWITPEILNLRNEMICLKDLSRAFPCFSEAFLESEKLYNDVIQTRERELNDAFLAGSTNKTGAAWRIINNKRSNYKNKSTFPDLSVGESVLCEQFNQHFVSASENLIKSNYGVDDYSVGDINQFIPPCSQSFYMFPVSGIDVGNAIFKLGSSMASGDDSVPSLLLKKSANFIADVLSYIISISLEFGVFPTLLKHATVLPLFKKDDPEDFNNYRPISILSVFSKLYEIIVNERLMSYFLKFKLMSCDQHGFSPGKSTDTAVFDFLRDVYVSIDQNLPCLSLLIDLTKAFDSVSHSLLLYKLSRYGVNGICLKWFESYLSGRKQRVSFNGSTSSLLDVRLGVPQGSVLGPTLFLIFINDFPKCLNGIASVMLYADDINLTISSKSIDNLFRTADMAMHSVNRWVRFNRIVVNIQKTQCMLFCNKRKFNISNGSMAGSQIDLVSSCRLLGIVIDEDLKWSEHIDQLCSKLSRSCYALFQLRKSCNLSTLKTFYYSDFYSRMRYGVIHWGMSSDVSRIFILQKRAIRTLFNLRRADSCRDIFKDNNIFTFYDMYIFEVLCYVYKNRNSFDFSLPHGYGTRNCDYVLPPRHRTCAFQKSLTFVGCRLFNVLPNEMKLCTSLHLFRRELKKHMFVINCYSINDFFEYFK